jgi:hypothetical protein
MAELFPYVTIVFHRHPTTAIFSRREETPARRSSSLSDMRSLTPKDRMTSQCRCNLSGRVGVPFRFTQRRGFSAQAGHLFDLVVVPKNELTPSFSPDAYVLSADKTHWQRAL